MYLPLDHGADLSEEEFRLLRDFIHERFGLYFEESQMSSLRSRLQGRVKSLDLRSFEDYYQYLRFGPQRGDGRGPQMVARESGTAHLGSHVCPADTDGSGRGG